MNSVNTEVTLRHQIREIFFVEKTLFRQVQGQNSSETKHVRNLLLIVGIY